VFTVTLAASVALGGACSSKSNPSATTPAPSASASTPPPFEPLSPEVYVAKVKNLLVGYAPTDAEVAAVKADPSALGGLIDGWMATPEYQKKMLGFFATSFQQSQVVTADFATQMPGVQGQIGNNGAVASRLLYGLRSSFALTVWQLLQEGRPFSEAITTRRFMLTPPLMALLAFMDEHHVDDASKVQDRMVVDDPNFAITVTAQAPIPLAESLDPKSPNYMHWYLPDLGKDAACGPGDPRVYKKSPAALYQVLMGGLETLTLADGTKCQGGASASPNGQWDANDFTAWKMVTLRQPKGAEAPTAFYDIPTLRSTSELVLRTPRIGFFTTPSFLAQWNTNLSNSARVTINQTLVVALGRIFDGSHPTMPMSQAAIELPHAGPPECAKCHVTLDPMRQYFRQAFTVNFHDQTDPAQTMLPGMFAHDGVTTDGSGGFAELGDQLAKHPAFPVAWVQKLCYYANSAPCSEDDPETQRIVAAFAAGQSWNALVKDVMSSPLTTGATETKTADANLASGAAVVPISRREHWCNALSNRLGIADACALTTAAKAGTPTAQIQAIAADLPSDGYGRGSPTPALANDPDMFFFGSVENLCRLVADKVVDAPGTTKYKSTDSAAAIADFVANVMALTSADPRAAGASAILTDHFQTAQAQGATPADALKSTFVLACTSPTSVGMGL
jgi:hypothetical protein